MLNRKLYSKLNNRIKNENGNAMIEIIPILAIFILLVNFSLGFFGLIHSGILGSIASRNYAFETFRNRADLRYLRDEGPAENLTFTYTRSEMRFHVIRSETAQNGLRFEATRRPIRFTEIRGVEDSLGDSEHDLKIKNIVEGERASDRGIDEGVNPAWVRTAYGICLNAKCGG